MRLWVPPLNHRGGRINNPAFVVLDLGRRSLTLVPSSPILPSSPLHEGTVVATLVGQTVSHYKILERLGGGGMGVVYKAQDLNLDRPVALKFLPPEFTRDLEAKQRFIREARAASALDHQNICVVHDIGETEDGQIFIVMAFYEGETLKKKIDRGPIGIDEALDIAIQVAQGLAKAHDDGILHRDIKPANIMVTRGGVAKIVDFGLAKLAGQTTLTRAGTAMGTTAYMSPEQTRGEAVDHRTDVWSLGVVLYQMLTGSLPFRGEFAQALMYSILNEKPRPLTESRVDLPPGMDVVVKKALEKQPSDRYGSSREMKDALVAIKGTSGERHDQPLNLRKPHSRRTVLFIALILLSLGAAALFFLPRGSPTGSPNIGFQTQTRKSSIAVLPFTDMSPAKDQDYFCSGIAEELTSVLAQIPELKVVSRTRVLTLSKNATDLKEMGSQLTVATLLDGSVRKAGNQLRITARLIDAVDGSLIWTDTYDRTLQDVFAIQKEVARAVVAALQITLAPQTTERMIPRQSSNVEAYEYWLRGSYFVKLYLISNKEQDIESAIRLYESAIALDSTYAIAYAGLAWAYEHKYLLLNKKHASDREQVVRCVLKAYQLDSLSGVVNAGMGYLALVNRDYDAAYRFFKTALALEPGSYLVNYIVGEFLASLGLNEQSEVFFEKSTLGDPYYLLGIGETACAYDAGGEFEKAATYYQRALQLSPSERTYHALYVELLIKTSRLTEASAILEESAIRSPEYPGFARCRALLHAMRGEKKRALDLAKLPEVYALLGMRDDAVRALEETDLTRGVYQYQSIATNPLFDSLRNDFRFQAILSRLETIYRERLKKYGGLGILTQVPSI